MLQAFLDQLEPRWGTSSDWIFVIANALWNGAEIDLVCILPSAILVADFKSHGGRLTGSENGPWQADGVLVKGGRKDNPYQQLRDNKFSTLNWLQSKSLLEGRNLGHISAGVVFGGSIEEHLELSSKVRSWFYPTDLCNCAALLARLASPELQIAWKEAMEIVQRLGVQPVEWLSSHPQVREIGQETITSSARSPLTSHQREALHALTNFASSEDLVTFSVLGMTYTGKSRLLAEAVTEVEAAGKKSIVLAPNRRLAMLAPVEAESIYGHLFGGGKSEGENGKIADKGPRLDVIPTRACNDEEDCVYLIDDAHLLGNSKFTTPDGKQYGSGHLLDDFYEFTGLGKTKRKAIFFGDPYQIQRSGDDESALLGRYQTTKELKHQFLELSQVIDTTGGSARLANAERLVKAIRSGRFAELDFRRDEGFRQADKLEAATEILDRYKFDPFSALYLAETHAKANAFSLWVRERIHGKRMLSSIEARDLLEIYVSPENTDYGIPSGSRRLVDSVGIRKTYEQALKGRNELIVFHSLPCCLEGTEQVSLNILEEFLISERPELSADTAIAENVLRKSVEPPSLPAFAYVRYGYASTVHHAQGMSRSVCYVNCDHSGGRHSEGFFRWLYSALTVAERELVLLNFAEVHPYDSAAWNAGAVSVAADIPIGAGWSFQPNGIASGRDQQRNLPPGLEQSKDVLKSVAIWLRIANAAETSGWQVASATYHPFQEQYELVGPHGEKSRLRVAYNAKNAITAMHLNDPVNWQLLSNLASECIEANGYSLEVECLLRSARTRLGSSGWKIVSATEASYRLLVTAARDHDERVSIEINFDKQGLVSSLRPLHTSDLDLLYEIKRALL